jgi:signal transduction histidine kinase
MDSTTSAVISPTRPHAQQQDCALPSRIWRVDRIMLFWFGIVVAVVVLAGAQTLADHPRGLPTWDVLLTGLLMLAYPAWFLVVARMFRAWRHEGRHWPYSARQVYPLLAVGLASSAGLILLHGEFIGLIYSDVSLIIMSVRWRAAVLPLAVLLPLYLVESGLTQGATAPELGYALISLVSISGIAYSLAALTRERVQRERLIVELREAHQQLRVSAARDVELAALRERNRLAREMHDSLGHALVLIAMQIEAAQRLRASDRDRAEAQLDETKALVRASMSDLRRSLAGLRLPALDEQPFTAAMSELACELERTGVEVSVSIADEADMLERPVQEALYRVAQEALANVARHAHARHAALSLTITAERARLEVGDDGVGLGAAPYSEGGHYGVMGMRERVEALGGTLALGPGLDGGTLLRATVPVREGADVRYPHPVG